MDRRFHPLNVREQHLFLFNHVWAKFHAEGLKQRSKRLKLRVVLAMNSTNLVKESTKPLDFILREHMVFIDNVIDKFAESGREKIRFITG
jgi:hypothetical protein